METIRILLIEDNRLLLEGISAMLGEQEEFEVVARSEDGDSVRQIMSLNEQPVVVLLDLGLEKANSLKLMAVLKEDIPSAKIIAMDILPDQSDILEFIKAGGHGLILKNAPLQDWVATIKSVVQGENVLPLHLTQSLFSQIISDALHRGREIPESSIRLTQRERQVVNLIADGLSNKEIAITLHIATYTVKSHVHNILEKLTLNTRLQIAIHARREGS